MRFFITLMMVISFLIASPMSQAVAKELKIVAGTTLLADILTELAPDATIRTVIPGGACPGHYDIKPGDLKLLSEADVLFIHPWQKMLGNMKRFIQAAENQNLNIRVVALKGNFMVPAVQAKAVEMLAAQLSELDTEGAAAFTAAAEKRTARVMSVGKELKQQLTLAGTGQKNVICAMMQKPFVIWAGYTVTASYGRPEDLNPDTVAGLISKARDSRVTLVIDNIQSGPDAGRGIAQDLGIKQVNLSNFPGAIKDTATWEKAVRANVALLLAAQSGS